MHNLCSRKLVVSTLEKGAVLTWINTEMHSRLIRSIDSALFATGGVSRRALAQLLPSDSDAKGTDAHSLPTNKIDLTHRTS